MSSKRAADDELLTVEQLAEMLHVKPQTVHSWRHRGVGPPAMRVVGGKVLFWRSAVSKWLSAQADERAGVA